MQDPFRPTYFLDFFNKYPSERERTMELNKDMWDEEVKLHSRLIKYNIVTAVPLFAYTCAYGSLPFLRKYGRVFGTHRSFRQHLYIAAIATTLALKPFYSKLHKTEAKLKEIDEFRVRTEGEYVQLSKPVSYNYKHY